MRTLLNRPLALFLALSLTSFLTACSDDDRASSGAGGSAASSAGSGATGGVGASSGTGGSGGVIPVDASTPFVQNDAGQVLCGSSPCQCHNGIDDDNDGFIDGLDTECTGPFDDDEGTFATGIPGDNMDFCQDCFFDGNSGAGDDKCAYHTDCLYGEAPSGGGNSDCHNCDVSTECVNFCKARTPNGCDCFGCCGVMTPSGETVNVVLAATCSLDVVDDETKCPRCVQAENGCINECGRCELCPGKTVEDLPADCYQPRPDAGIPDGGITYPPPQSCDEGQTPCDEGNACASTYFCLQGCCVPILY